jgi:hypothetical protein
MQSQAIRLYTVLRDPVEKFFSGVYFWHRLITPELADKITRPSHLKTSDIDALAATVFKYGAGTVGRAGPVLQYAYVLGRLQDSEKDNPTPRALERACANLENDFTVGTTENMDSFIVLIALENGWPLEEMCYFRSHVNKERPKNNAFTPEVLAHITKLVAPDQHILECARAAHARQTAQHRNFTAALNLFTSAAFVEKCDGIKRRNVKAEGAKSKADQRNNRAQSCTFLRSPEDEGPS